MFKAVRDSFLGLGRRLGASWRAMQPRRLAGLFVFEFIVVLLGVPAAENEQEGEN